MSNTTQSGDPAIVTLTSGVSASTYTIPTTISGSTLISNSSNYSWAQPSISTTFTAGGSGKTVMSIPANSEEVIIEPTAALTVKGKVVINGENLEDRLNRIETLLNIPIRDKEMEEEFPKLKQLWQEYEQELEKYKTWKRLNK